VSWLDTEKCSVFFPAKAACSFHCDWLSQPSSTVALALVLVHAASRQAELNRLHLPFHLHHSLPTFTALPCLFQEPARHAPSQGCSCQPHVPGACLHQNLRPTTNQPTALVCCAAIRMPCLPCSVQPGAISNHKLQPLYRLALLSVACEPTDALCCTALPALQRPTLLAPVASACCRDLLSFCISHLLKQF
jgi:hypothetical protein